MSILILIKTWEVIAESLYYDQEFENLESDRLGRYGY